MARGKKFEPFEENYESTTIEGEINYRQLLNEQLYIVMRLMSVALAEGTPETIQAMYDSLMVLIASLDPYQDNQFKGEMEKNEKWETVDEAFERIYSEESREELDDEETSTVKENIRYKLMFEKCRKIYPFVISLMDRKNLLLKEEWTEHDQYDD